MSATDILTVNQIKLFLRSFGIKLRKQLGQNFLVDSSLVNQLIEAIDPQKEDLIVEIGGGLGAVTLPLAQLVKRLIVFEIDPKLSTILHKRAEEVKLSEKIEIRTEDFLNTRCLMEARGRQKIKVVGSLPYSATSPILHKLIERHYKQWDEAVFILQKEVVDKIMQASPKASYWYHFIHNYYDSTVVVKKIKPVSFWPQPKVDSSMLKLSRKVKDFSPEPSEWPKFLHRVFKHPRKQIGKVFSEEQLGKAGIERSQRPGELRLEQLLQLFTNP